MNQKNIKHHEEKKFISQENKLSEQTDAFIGMLIKRGILDDQTIGDEEIRKATQKKKRKLYHNTLVLLQNYRNIVWALECFPSNTAEELDQPMLDVDALISVISNEIDMNNTKLENRLQSIKRSRLLLDRFNEAISILRKKPGNGELMYNILYLTFLNPERLSHSEILYRLSISSRHYYRIRQQAINILSIRLWASPIAEVDCWLEVLSLLEVI